MNDRSIVLIGRNDLREKGIKYSRQHLWELIDEGRFPRPRRGFGKAHCWIEAEIDAWIEQRLAEDAVKDAERAARGAERAARRAAKRAAKHAAPAGAQAG